MASGYQHFCIQTIHVMSHCLLENCSLVSCWLRTVAERTVRIQKVLLKELFYELSVTVVCHLHNDRGIG